MKTELIGAGQDKARSAPKKEKMNREKSYNSKIGKDGKVVIDQEMADNLYTIFVLSMHKQWGGPAVQLTPRTNTLDEMASALRKRDGEGFCYALCSEYLSNHIGKR